METCLTEYIKKGNQKVGMLVAKKFEMIGCDYVSVGYSLCNPKDRFDKEKAFDLAMARSKNDPLNSKLPPSIIPQLTVFIDRITRYYKDVPSENIPKLTTKKTYFLN